MRHAERQPQRGSTQKSSWSKFYKKIVNGRCKVPNPCCPGRCIGLRSLRASGPKYTSSPQLNYLFEIARGYFTSLGGSEITRASGRPH